MRDALRAVSDRTRPPKETDAIKEHERAPTGSKLYPLCFEPIFQERIWGGRRLENWLQTPLPGEGPIGEAWVLSDRDDHPSRVANGPLSGQTIAQLVETSAISVLGALATRFERFPLLLKFLDVRRMLSVQVHPGDDASELLPRGETGKTEAWVVLEADPGSRVYAGLKPSVTANDLRGLSAHTVKRYLADFEPQPGDSVLIEAGVVHALGDGILVFEVQENSDVTFRLYDWGHVDPKTGRSRALHVDSALACIDFAQGAILPVVPVFETFLPALRELLVDCRHFRLWRLLGSAPFTVGAANAPRVLVGIDGAGNVEYEGADFPLKRGTIILLPAALGPCRFRPEGSAGLLEIAMPDPA